MSDREDHNIWTALFYDDAHAARDWLRALGFADGIVVAGETEGTIVHSEMLWPEGGRLMVATRSDETATDLPPPGSAWIYVVTDHPDEVHGRARALGATIVHELEDTDYGSRGFTVNDDEGNRISFGTYSS